jgi:prepilin-type processing-associated H-X9-DG protein
MECIVVMVILLMIMAVAAPYLLKNRELARKSQCQQNMIEINRGLLAYTQLAGRFPSGRAEPQPYSAIASIIEFTSAADNLNAIDFQQPIDQSELYGARIALLLCPSQATPVFDSKVPTGFCNYAFSTGSGNSDGSLGKSDGVFHSGLGIEADQAMNRSSTTVAFSERILGTGDVPPKSKSLEEPNQYRWLMWVLPAELVANGQNCQGDSGAWNTSRGHSWLVGDYLNTLYNHALPPNSTDCDCSAADFMSGRFAASSLHGRGVNVSRCDGSVQFVSDLIDHQIWQAISIRDSARVEQLEQ